jgi:hypothetical protein
MILLSLLLILNTSRCWFPHKLPISLYKTFLKSTHLHQQEFNILIENFEKYKERHETLHLLENQDSRPHDDLLENYSIVKTLHEVRCGKISLSMEQKQKLQELGISVNIRDYQFECFILGLQQYILKNNGKLSIPREFIIPSNSDWPLQTWGMKLGQKVYDARAGRIFKSYEQRKRLGNIGFIWKPGEKAVHLLVSALETFRSIHGHLNVPKHYIIPENSIYNAGV